MNSAEPLDETPPEAPATGREEHFVTSFQTKHPEFTVTEIRSALRHVALELVLEDDGERLYAGVEQALRR